MHLPEFLLAGNRVPQEDVRIPVAIEVVRRCGAFVGGRNWIVIRGVGLNPTRTGLLTLLERMGADVHVEDEGEVSGEPVGTLVVHPTRLEAIDVGREDIPASIDEIPILAVAAARAEGVTRITGAGELRLKETDRIRALVANLRSLGVTVEESDDGLEIEGTDRPLHGSVPAFDDHRIAMAFAVLGAIPGNEVSVDDPAVVEVSYPDFWSDVESCSRS